MNGKTLRELALTAIRRHALVSAAAAEPHRRDGGKPARLGAVAPARSGRAAGHLRRQGFRHGAERQGRVRAHRDRPSKAEGADAWFTSPPERFLGEARKAEDYEQVTDILDVWFDSAPTHTFVFENPIDPAWPKAEQSRSLSGRLGPASRLVPVLAAGRRWARAAAPYTGVLTHGFVLDEQGRKMSKSLGNTVGAPGHRRKERRRNPAPVGGARSTTPRICTSARTSSRPMSNPIAGCATPSASCWRSLSGFDEKEAHRIRLMPELERFMLARLAELDGAVRDAYAAFRLQPGHHHAVQFLHQRSARPSISRHPQGRAVCRPRRSASAAAASAPSATKSSAASSPGSRPSSASPWKKPGPRASAWTTGCICTISSRRRRVARSEPDREVEAGPRTAPRRHRRAGEGARAEKADRLQPGSGADPCYG